MLIENGHYHYTPSEVASQLGYANASSVYRLIRTGVLPASRRGNKLLIHHIDLDNFKTAKRDGLFGSVCGGEDRHVYAKSEKRCWCGETENPEVTA